MNLVSWNVNGLRACMKSGFAESYKRLDADVLCLQEIKLSEAAQVEDALQEAGCGAARLWHPSVARKGYSGTAAFLREGVEPLSVSRGMGERIEDNEGRVLTLEFPSFYMVTVYTPNSQDGLRRLDYRMGWDDAFRDYLLELDSRKPVAACGDLNVAHNPIDIKNPSSNHHNAGFTDQEREKFTRLLGAGFVDTFRQRNPDLKHAYTWWSYFSNSRARNAGWRIDYFIVSERLNGSVTEAMIYPDVMGSDHCPVGIKLDI